MSNEDCIAKRTRSRVATAPQIHQETPTTILNHPLKTSSVSKTSQLNSANQDILVHSIQNVSNIQQEGAQQKTPITLSKNVADYACSVLYDTPESEKRKQSLSTFSPYQNNSTKRLGLINDDC